jgi:CubicO group peptidase (beta-lactamase class C family)
VGALDLIDGWPGPRSSAGVLVRRGDEVEVAGIRGDPESVFEWASVTKLLVAMAVLVACEEATTDLSDPAGPEGSTVRHLLSHASGLGPESLEPLTSPGSRRIYSNAGFEVLAAHLQTRTGRSWRDSVVTGVLGPAGLEHTRFPEGASPAWGAVGSLGDLLALGIELLVPTVLSDETLQSATAVNFPGLPGVVPGVGRYEDCVWGLGFELKGSKQPHWTATKGSAGTFGHFGRSGAFLWVDPVAGVAAVAGGGAAFGPWAVEAWSTFSDAVLSEFSAQEPAG